MQNFVVITDTPQRLATFLTNRGLVQQVSDGQGGQTYVGVKPGLEFVEVPNPIVTDPGSGGDPRAPGYVPPTYDTRKVYMVKLAHDSEAADNDGPAVDAEGNPVPQYDRSKLGKWATANTSKQTAPANFTIHGEPVGDAYKVTGQNVWFVKDDPERFGVWQ